MQDLEILPITVFIFAMPFGLYLIDSRDTDNKWFGDVIWYVS